MRLKNLTCGYDEKRIPIKELSAELIDEGVVAISGKSGSGKSTLLKTMAGILAVRGGSIEGLENKKLSMVFQENRLINEFSALQNVALTCDDESRCLMALNMVELSEAASRYVANLSGGMQRRVAIARAIAYGGDVLLLDEAFTGLDTALYIRIAQRLGEEFSLIVMCTHDLDEAYAIGKPVQILTI